MVKGLLIAFMMVFAAVMLIAGAFLMHYVYHHYKAAGASDIKILVIGLPVSLLHTAVMAAVILLVKWKIDAMNETEL